LKGLRELPRVEDFGWMEAGPDRLKAELHTFGEGEFSGGTKRNKTEQLKWPKVLGAAGLKLGNGGAFWFPGHFFSPLRHRDTA